MKHSINYISKLLTTLSRYGKVLLLFSMLTVASGSAWGGDWYIWGFIGNAIGNLNSPCTSGVTLADNGTTRVASFSVPAKSDYQFFFCTKSKSTAQAAYDDGKRGNTPNSFTLTVENTNNKGWGTCGDHSQYTMYKFWNGNTSAVDVVLTYTNSTNTFSIDPASVSHAPSIYIGKRPTVSGSAATINLQLSDWGCENVDKVKIYYTTDGSTPSTSSSSWEVTLASEKTSNANFDVTKSSLSTGTYKIKVSAHNSEGYGDLSDMSSFTISCTKPVAPTSDEATSKVTTDDALCEGKTITLKAPTGFTGSPTSYVWNINGSDDGSQTGDTYTYTVPSSGFTAKVKGANACGTSDNYSYETTFSSIIAKPTTTYNVGGGGTICSTGSTSITLDGSQSGFKYQLYKGDDPVEGKVIDGDGSELSFADISASGTYYVYAYKSGSASCSFKMNGSTSSSATVTVVNPAAITSISSSSTECEGDSKVLSVTGNASTTGYQWYKDGNTISGATSNSYTVSEISETASYTCLPFNETCSWGASSDATTITMAPKPIGTAISGPATACKGQTSLSYTASSDAVAGSTYSYSWSVESGGWTRTSTASSNPATFTAGTGTSGTIGVTPTLTTSGKACAGSKVTKTVSTPNKTVTIKVEKKGVAASTAPYVYVWTEGVETWSGPWHGDLMEDDPYNAGWWTADISVGRCNYQLIFSDESNQTANSPELSLDEVCFSFSENSWSSLKPEEHYADCPIACTPPTTQTVTASKAATCKNSSEYVTVASSQVGYTYELYYRISPADYATTGNTVEGTGSALKISTGKLTSTGTYDLQVKAFDTTTGGCVTVMNPSAAQITTSSVAGPGLSMSSASAKNFESVTVSSDVAATWAVSNKETVGGVDDSYISPTSTAANETTVFKGTVGSSSSSKDFLVTATSVAQSSCTSTLVVNVSKDAESCE